MHDIKINIAQIGTNNKSEVIVDGKDLAALTTGIDFNFIPREFPVLNLDLELFGNCELNIQGDVLINKITIPDDIAKQVYEKLKEKFEQMTDLEKFIELYKSFGIDCRVNIRENNKVIIIGDQYTGDYFPSSFKITHSDKISVGWPSWITMVFNNEGQFITQEIDGQVA